AVHTVLGGPAPADPFDLVLLDPPYDTSVPELEEVLDRLGSGGWLGPDATMVVERAADSPSLRWPAGWGSTWERCYGDTLVLFAQRK
ncbi:MAG: RsmD family RNA methyltransferase, partial [Acidimicrobiia bacterium]